MAASEFSPEFIKVPNPKWKATMKILKYSGYSFAIIVAFFVVVLIVYERPMAFDKEVWLNSDKINQKPYPRLKMADDLIKKDVLIGLTRSQVIELLGEPGDHGYFRSYDLVYWLGPERSFMGIDSEWLAILIDDNGLVSKVALVRD